ncbi:MAG TPA: D-alanyl-D-alanine carboxypeptidase/D-alanyl-D-alanine-endopeptidase [Bryobacteraceae bacterium]|nr:D-alanyl-D-alanine carboxypeptidase/D-alanyl-D-alanine-endopeptidase [Bryobacteraceae bacterium]
MRILLLLWVAQSLICAQTVSERISSLLDEAAAARHGFWGISAVDLKSGETRFGRFQDRVFVPASVAKLFSTALGLQRLGPDHRFTTTVAAAAPPDASGRLAGNLYLVGGGDPTISSRPYPHGSGSSSGNPLRAIEDLADQVVARGVRRIAGDVVGDDTAYPWEPYPDGRMQEDALWGFGAPVSALSVSENRLTLTFAPGRRAGDQARLRLTPPLDYFVIDNRVRTSAGGPARIDFERLPGSRQLRVWGSLPLGSSPSSRLLALDDPAQFAAAALLDALTRRGVAVEGRAVARHRFLNEDAGVTAAGVELARRESPPLSQILEVTSKESLNLSAELVLREVGRVRRDAGTRQAGMAELAALAKEVGIPEEECALVDASGLSTLDAVSPRAVTSLLVRMYASPDRQTWLGMLPVGGKEGTLRNRFTELPPASVRAKTGTMSRVSALAGYLETSSGETLAFAILVNNYTAPAREIRSLIDRIVMLLVQQGS